MTHVYNHVYSQHLFGTSSGEAALCQWAGCDLVKRQKWSLINHLQEKHCNEAALQAAVLSRQRGIIPTPSVSISASNLNTKDAALLAIQRHQKKNMEEFWVFFILEFIEKKVFYFNFFCL